MSTRRARRKAAFLDRYDLDHRFLQRANAKTGRPGIIAGVDKETGLRVVIKEWQRTPGIVDEEMREIWRQEIRQLHRLGGYPGARDHIVMLQDSAEDAQGFYLVLSPGQRLPLHILIESARDQHWIRHPRQERFRRRLWQDLRRISIGLDVLHSQGLLHRNLDTWSVFTAGGDEPDFQLSGFEWSIRLIGAADNLPQRAKRSDAIEEPLVFSFLQDWQAFGRLASTLLGVDFKSLEIGKAKDGKASGDFLTGLERDLLLTLVRADPQKRLDGEVVSQRIDAIISALTHIVARRDSRLFLACGLADAGNLSRAIRTASDKAIEINDIDRQQAFIRADLSDEPVLVSLADDTALTGQRYVLVGRTLTYRLSAFQPRHRSEATWEVAYCESATPQRPAQSAIRGQTDLTDTPLEVMVRQDAERKLATIQGKAARWDKQIEKPAREEGEEEASRQYRALVLVQLLEAIQIVTEIWPVTVVGKKQINGRVSLSIKTRHDEERDKLSHALGLNPPHARMYAAFTADQTAGDDDWTLTEVGVIGERDKESTRWRFTEVREKPGHDPIYIFEGTGEPPIHEALFLREADYVGQDSLLRRRIKALRALRDHTELLSMLADPGLGIRQTHETIREDSGFAELDTSKKDALKELWGVLPIYLVQGPPGVGKTRLVRELVARRFQEDRTTRMLLTAQNHHSVDHLLGEVEKVIQGLDGELPITVRCRPKGYSASPGPFDLRTQARGIVNRLVDSDLAVNAPQSIRDRLTRLKATFGEGVDDEEDPSVQRLRPDRAFEALLLRSANIVFASTNAADLERMIEERAQADWTIIEEAGRATGVELVAPLLLSHRRLMIGDHKQLPPFGADQLIKLLSKPDKVRAALDFGRPLVSRPFREAGMEDVIDELESEEATAVCSEAASALLKFESMIEAQFSRDPQRSKLPIAKRLNHQHRMHPSIAKLVSESFYECTLKTDETCRQRFQTANPPFLIANKSLPSSPIVFVNMPYVQSTVGARHAEQQPRYHNPDEVEAVLKVMGQFRANPAAEHPPTLAVLSPYREQVRKLRDRINEERDSRLPHLSEFRFDGEDGTPVGTVDSFQGNEADIVIVSMVRNNHHSGKRSLGFLSDQRRMNVLLSRAKWKLILVGSLEFLGTRFAAGIPVPKSDPIAFLHRVLGVLGSLQNEQDSKGVHQATVIPVSGLAGGPK